MIGELIRAIDMQLADTIQPIENSDGFTTCTVKQVTETQVTLFRPYVHTADFSYTGGVICYIGFEEYCISRQNEGYHWRLLTRKALK